MEIKGKIIYGGAFNPPTIAHKRIGKYLIDNYKDIELIYLPTNSFYNKDELVSFTDRFEMTKLLVKDLDNVEVSDYEGKEHKFSGTYYTLKYFNHPLFVIGADSLANLPNWIRGNDLIKENNFIVFPRKNYDLDLIFKNEILNQYKDHFIVLKDYKEDDVSSTNYRNYKDEMLLTEEVKKYIKEKGLYR